jgi:hypothetical protein
MLEVAGVEIGFVRVGLGSGAVRPVRRTRVAQEP